MPPPVRPREVADICFQAVLADQHDGDAPASPDGRCTSSAWLLPSVTSRRSRLRDSASPGRAHRRSRCRPPARQQVDGRRRVPTHLCVQRADGIDAIIELPELDDIRFAGRSAVARRPVVTARCPRPGFPGRPGICRAERSTSTHASSAARLVRPSDRVGRRRARPPPVRAGANSLLNDRQIDRPVGRDAGTSVLQAAAASKNSRNHRTNAPPAPPGSRGAVDQLVRRAASPNGRKCRRRSARMRNCPRVWTKVNVAAQRVTATSIVAPRHLADRQHVPRAEPPREGSPPCRVPGLVGESPPDGAGPRRQHPPVERASRAYSVAWTGRGKVIVASMLLASSLRKTRRVSTMARPDSMVTSKAVETADGV